MRAHLEACRDGLDLTDGGEDVDLARIFERAGTAV
jgi:hypothetical protein